MPDEPLGAELVLRYAWPVLDDQQPVRDLLARTREQVNQLAAREPALLLDEPKPTIVDRAQLPPKLAAARPDVPDSWELAVTVAVRALRLPAPGMPATERARLRRHAVQVLTDEPDWPTARIAEVLGIRPDYVKRLRSDLRLRAEPPSRALARTRRDEIQRLAGQGWSDERIADHLGLTPSHVGKVRAQLHVTAPPHPRSQSAQFHRDAIAALAGQDWTGARIAREVGLSRQYVSRILAELRRGAAAVHQATES